MTKMIQRLTSLIALHTLGWGLTHAAGILLLHVFDPTPLARLAALYFTSPLWIIGTVFYLVWLQWFFWRVWLEARQPRPQPAPKPRLASIYGSHPLHPGERELTYTRITLETWTVREHERAAPMIAPRPAWDEPVDVGFRVIDEGEGR